MEPCPAHQVDPAGARLVARVRAGGVRDQLHIPPRGVGVPEQWSRVLWRICSGCRDRQHSVWWYRQHTGQRHWRLYRHACAAELGWKPEPLCGLNRPGLHNGDLLRGAAVMTTPTIVTRAGWGARAPRGSVATTTWARRTGVAIHHSAGPTTQTVRSIQDHQMDHNGWQDIGYNWLVTQDGRVWEGRAGGWLAVGAHAANQNTAWIGICWIGNSGSTAPSAAALAAIRWLVDEARRLAGRRLEVRGHGQVPGQATECPGARLRAWISDGMPTTGGGGSAPPATGGDPLIGLKSGDRGAAE